MESASYDVNGGRKAALTQKRVASGVALSSASIQVTRQARGEGQETGRPSGLGVEPRPRSPAVRETANVLSVRPYPTPAKKHRRNGVVVSPLLGFTKLKGLGN